MADIEAVCDRCGRLGPKAKLRDWTEMVEVGRALDTAAPFAAGPTGDGAGKLTYRTRHLALCPGCYLAAEVASREQERTREQARWRNREQLDDLRSRRLRAALLGVSALVLLVVLGALFVTLRRASPDTPQTASSPSSQFVTANTAETTTSPAVAPAVSVTPAVSTSPTPVLPAARASAVPASAPPSPLAPAAAHVSAPSEAAFSPGASDPNDQDDSALETPPSPRPTVAGPVKAQTPSLDGGYVYEQVPRSADSDEIVQIRRSDGRTRDVIDANSLAVIRDGPYRGYLLLQRHRPGSQDGGYDPFSVVRPDGMVMFEVPGSDDDEGAVGWLRAHQWRAW